MKILGVLVVVLGLFSGTAFAKPPTFTYDTPGIGAAAGAAVGVTASGAVGSVAGVALTTSAAVGAGYGIMIDVLIRGNDSLFSQAVMGLCTLMGGEQSPEDNYQTCD